MVALVGAHSEFLVSVVGAERGRLPWTWPLAQGVAVGSSSPGASTMVLMRLLMDRGELLHTILARVMRLSLSVEESCRHILKVLLR